MLKVLKSFGLLALAAGFVLAATGYAAAAARAVTLWTYSAQVTYFGSDGKTSQFATTNGTVTADGEAAARALAQNEARGRYSNVLAVSLLYVLPIDSDPKKGASTVPPEPAKPAGLVQRWYVHKGRDADRDNRLVDLPKGKTAHIVVHLPENVRDKFRFNLKHDKHNAPDRGRTDVIGHGSKVSGDAHDWKDFGTRIYLGERSGEKDVFDAAPNGFYVDLVLD